MRAVVQRVRSAKVEVGERLLGEIAAGLLVLVGVGRGDTADDVAYIGGKLRQLRIFDGADGRPNDRTVTDVGGALLVVSQFTLYGDVRKGRRPSFDAAAPPHEARTRYEELVRELAASMPVATGEFGAAMQVTLVNDGPVTILLDSQRRF